MKNIFRSGSYDCGGFQSGADSNIIYPGEQPTMFLTNSPYYMYKGGL